MIHPENQYFKKMVAWINSYEEDLWNNLERVPHLEPQVGQALLSGFLQLACQCQNIGNILLRAVNHPNHDIKEAGKSYLEP